MTISSVDLAINNDIVSLQDNGDGRQHLRRQTQSSCTPETLDGCAAVAGYPPMSGRWSVHDAIG